MRMLLAILPVLGIFSSLGVSAAVTLNSTCWDIVQEELSPGMTSDLECVLANATDDFAVLCSLDGVNNSNFFNRYLSFRSIYQEALAEADSFFELNPNVPQLPLRIASKIENAKLDLLVAGKQRLIESSMENVRRKTSACD